MKIEVTLYWELWHQGCFLGEDIETICQVDVERYEAEPDIGVMSGGYTILTTTPIFLVDDSAAKDRHIVFPDWLVAPFNEWVLKSPDDIIRAVYLAQQER